MAYRKNNNVRSAPLNSRAREYVPESWKIKVGVDTIEKLQANKWKTITSQALIQSYMAMSKAKAEYKKEFAPIIEETSLGVNILRKMTKVTVPAEILLQELTEKNRVMIESTPVILSYQSMAEFTERTEHKIGDMSIPRWECTTIGNKAHTRVYDVLKAIREKMSVQWILDLKVESKELSEGVTFINIWVLAVKSLVPSNQARKSMALWFEDVGTENFEKALEQGTADNNTQDEQPNEQDGPVANVQQIIVEESDSGIETD